jgi:hypothetical protein
MNRLLKPSSDCSHLLELSSLQDFSKAVFYHCSAWNCQLLVLGLFLNALQASHPCVASSLEGQPLPCPWPAKGVRSSRGLYWRMGGRGIEQGQEHGGDPVAKPCNMTR